MTRSASPADFTPALGQRSLTGLYDAVIAPITRERVWRSALIGQLAPRDGETIIDVGCGTGTLATLIKAAAPGADMIGIDPDPEVLARARAKALGRGANLPPGLRGRRLGPERPGPGGQDRVQPCVSPSADRRQARRAGGDPRRPAAKRGIAHRRLWLAAHAVDALSVRQVQALDGVENTRLSVAGGLPELIAEAGFEGVEERAVLATSTGSISLYRAEKPRDPASRAS